MGWKKGRERKWLKITKRGEEEEKEEELGVGEGKVKRECEESGVRDDLD